MWSNKSASICFSFSLNESSRFLPFALGHSCPNASYKHFSLFRPRQYNGTDTSHLHAGTRPHAKFDYDYLVFSHSSNLSFQKRRARLARLSYHKFYSPYSFIIGYRQSAILFFQRLLYSSCVIQIPFKFLTFNHGSVSIHYIEIFIWMCVNEHSQLAFSDRIISGSFFNGQHISTPDRNI